MKFATQLILIVLTIAIGSGALAKKQDLNQYSVDDNLINFLSRSSAILQENPERSVSCFEHYLPVINQCGLDYEERYKTCLSNSKTAAIQAEKDTEEDRKQLASNSEAACAAVKQCGSDPEASAEKIFECYVSSGSDSSKSLYGVSTAATIKLHNLQEALRRIKNDEAECTTSNKIRYEKELADTYEEFNKCINGESTVPPPETATPTEPTNETSTTEENSTADESTEDDPSRFEKMPEEDIYRFMKRFIHSRH